MNSLFGMLGIEAWKPILTALLLPPVPLLLAMFVGARLMLPRRGLGWLLIVLSCAGIWLSACTGVGRMLEQFLLHVPPALTAERLREIKSDTGAKATTAIVVLGGGVEPFAPEYGVTNLDYQSLERLRYGLWLSRETGVPVGFSGGVGRGQTQGAAEAEVAARIAAQEFGRPLRWTEDQSRDTRENAARTVPLMQSSGITRILLVTHGAHMPRAKRAFDEAAAARGLTVEAAPMGLAGRIEVPALDWLPTALGTSRVRTALREWLGRVMGA
ncbi:YdcF family protein [Piscinibacter sp.]|uniref:YdcF family protein n=1 Tax=Piscinibacter sp. TaxID=1903157 RepID=UPI00355971E6